MEQISSEIRVGYSDRETNALLAAVTDAQRPFSRHFNQSEDFFLLLEDAYTVPHLPIHHDVRLRTPTPAYAAALRGVLTELARLAPQALKDLAYFFDPSEILRPCFYRLYRVEDSLYLYLLRVDLNMRATESTVIERGTNDTTPHYSSRRVFLEPTVIPLEEAVREDGVVQGFRIRQTISQTWIGEYGRGYFQQGIWMDADLTKFFSRLFLPAGRKTYPFYPYLCKYKTVCQSVVDLSPHSRAALIPALHRCLAFLLPVMERIQAEMKHGSFSEELEFFRELKGQVPGAWYAPWEKIRIRSYLNDQDMKEYEIED
ncbi:MAG: hypothetical protein ABSG63_08650 [Spirochaetia bacterium]